MTKLVGKLTTLTETVTISMRQYVTETVTISMSYYVMETVTISI